MIAFRFSKKAAYPWSMHSSWDFQRPSMTSTVNRYHSLLFSNFSYFTFDLFEKQNIDSLMGSWDLEWYPKEPLYHYFHLTVDFRDADPQFNTLLQMISDEFSNMAQLDGLCKRRLILTLDKYIKKIKITDKAIAYSILITICSILFEDENIWITLTWIEFLTNFYSDPFLEMETYSEPIPTLLSFLPMILKIPWIEINEAAADMWGNLQTLLQNLSDRSVT